jgi:PAS domain S-box-containing protein
VLATSNEMLGVQLGANRVGYAEIDPADEDAIIVAHDWTDGSVASVVGRHSFLAFGERHCALLRRGGIFRLEDTDDGYLSKPERPAYDAMRIRAAVSVPLIKQDRLIAVLSVHQNRPRVWTDAEVLLMQEVAERTWAAVERTRAEWALSRSEEKYRSLFESIDEGVATVEVLFDDEDKAVDYVILENNQAHEKMSGMPRTFVGKRVREVMPNIEESIIERVGRVALTGEPIRFEEYVSALGRWFEIYLSRVGGEGSRTVASLANNITERKRREHHAAFLDKLSQALTLLESPDEIVRATGEALGPYLDVSYLHVVGVELDPGEAPAEARLTALAAWEREGFFVPGGAYRAGDYLSEEFLRAVSAGEPVVVSDTDTDPRTDREAYRAVRIRAFIAVPILQDDVWPGLISVGTTEPRDWRPDEVTLIVEVAHRVFRLFERVRAEEALRDSAVRTRSLQRQLMESEETERRAIHRELHDRIGQDLASAKLNIELARSDAAAVAATGARLEAARDLVQSAIQHSRDIMAELRPPGLDDHGLAVALELYAEAVAKRLSISVTVRGVELEVKEDHPRPAVIQARLH